MSLGKIGFSFVFPLLLTGCFLDVNSSQNSNQSNNNNNNVVIDPNEENNEENNTYEEPASMTFKQKNSRLIDKMPFLSDNYSYVDWANHAKQLDNLLFDFARNPEYVIPSQTSPYGPLGYWDKANKSFGLQSYIGHSGENGKGTMEAGKQESLPVVNSVFGASLAGIDKSKQSFSDINGNVYTYDFVSMLKAFYNPNVELFSNNIGGVPSSSFWYDLYPHILISRICNLYPNVRDDTTNGLSLKQMLINSANKWMICSNKILSTGNIKYSGFDFATQTLTIENNHIEPPVGGLLYVFYNAYQLTGESSFITNGVLPILDYLETHNINPNFEIMSDYIPYVASVVNFNFGTNYDVERHLNNLFENDSDCRKGMGISCSKWGNFDAYGLSTFEMGGMDCESGYAFAMNTFHLMSTLVPMLNYNPSYANIVGKWILNVTNSAKIFFGSYLPKSNQSCSANLLDPFQLVAYEGCRTSKNNQTPFACGDPLSRGWGQTDYGIYGSSLVGVFGGLVSKTEDDRILRTNISKADSLDENGFTSYLYYNPYNEVKNTTLFITEKSDIFDVTNNCYIKRNASGSIKIELSPTTSKIIKILPINSEIVRIENGTGLDIGNNGYYVSGKTKISCFGKPCLNLDTKIVPRTDVDSNLNLKFSAHISEGDSIKKIEVYVNGSIYSTYKYSDNFTLNVIDLKAKEVFGDTLITFKAYSDKYLFSDSTSIRINII